MVLPNCQLSWGGGIVSIVTLTGIDDGQSYWKKSREANLTIAGRIGYTVTAVALHIPAVGIVLAIALRIFSAIAHSTCCQRPKRNNLVQPPIHVPPAPNPAQPPIQTQPPIQISQPPRPLPIISTILQSPQLPQEPSEAAEDNSNGIGLEIVVVKPPVISIPLEAPPEATARPHIVVHSPTRTPNISIIEKPPQPPVEPASPMDEENEKQRGLHHSVESLRPHPAPPGSPQEINARQLLAAPESDLKEVDETKEFAIQQPELSEQEISVLNTVSKEFVKEGSAAFSATRHLSERIQILEKELSPKSNEMEKKSAVSNVQKAANEVHEQNKKCYSAVCMLTHKLHEELQTTFKNNHENQDFVKLQQCYNKIRDSYYLMVRKIEIYKEKLLATYGELIANTLTTPATEYLRKPNSWEAYCNTYSPEISLDIVEQMRKSGQDLLDQILRGNKEIPKTKENVKCIIWALIYRAVNKKQGYEEGAFVIQDENKYIFNFLLSCEGHYTRSSSHPLGNQCEGVNWLSYIMETATQHGIDVHGLPAGKSTIVFDLLNKGKFERLHAIYIKPENHGTSGWMDFVWHSIEYIKARQNKKVVGADDKANMRKERIPKEEIKLFRKIEKHCEEIYAKLENETSTFLMTHSDASMYQCMAFLKQTHEAKDEGSLGISYMMQYMQSISFIQFYPKFETQLFRKIEREIKELNFLLGKYDHLEFRTGREVCFIADELLK